MSAGMVSPQMIDPGATRCLSIILNDVRAQRKLIFRNWSAGTGNMR